MAYYPNYDKDVTKHKPRKVGRFGKVVIDCTVKITTKMPCSHNIKVTAKADTEEKATRYAKDRYAAEIKKHKSCE